jgi:hypothetical protein
MLLIVLALLWVAILIPIGVRHFRENGTERSIESFHAEHEVLSRQEYVVAPAHRLEEPLRRIEEPRRRDEWTYEEEERPQLKVVSPDDTYGSIESRATWDEWTRNYDFEREQRQKNRENTNRYAAAYSSTPSENFAVGFDQSYRERPSMKVRRRRIFTSLGTGALVFTVMSFMVKSSLIQYVAILSWLGLMAFLGLALVSLSLGYLGQGSASSVARGEEYVQRRGYYDEEYDEQDGGYYDPAQEAQWYRENAARRALG